MGGADPGGVTVGGADGGGVTVGGADPGGVTVGGADGGGVMAGGVTAGGADLCGVMTCLDHAPSLLQARNSFCLSSHSTDRNPTHSNTNTSIIMSSDTFKVSEL